MSLGPGPEAWAGACHRPQQGDDRDPPAAARRPIRRARKGLGAAPARWI